MHIQQRAGWFCINTRCHIYRILTQRNSTLEHASVDTQISAIVTERCLLIIHLSKWRCAILWEKNKRELFESHSTTCENALQIFEAMFESWNVIMYFFFQEYNCTVSEHYRWNFNQCGEGKKDTVVLLTCTLLSLSLVKLKYLNGNK